MARRVVCALAVVALRMGCPRAARRIAEGVIGPFFDRDLSMTLDAAVIADEAQQ